MDAAKYPAAAFKAELGFIRDVDKPDAGRKHFDICRRMKILKVIALGILEAADPKEN